ncbi:hypothetical protein IPM62_02170 [Candidatus Woesebacteria bacterium]|nr:MAG: hypothetical protein IPM62_02170 [Candidatus Woesebacteria bacterium]
MVDNESDILYIPYEKALALAGWGVINPGRRKLLGVLTKCAIVVSLPPSLLIACAEPDNTGQVQATSQALQTTRTAAINATSEARTPEIYQAEMREIPPNLVNSAVRVEITTPYLDTESNKVTEMKGSGTVIEVDTQNKIVYVLTNGHIANSLSKENSTIQLTQNHCGEKVEEVSHGYASTLPLGLEKEPIDMNNPDQAVIAIRYEGELNIPPFGMEKLISGQISNVGEKLHALTFTSAAFHQDSIFPINLHVSRTGENKAFFGSTVSGGCSGSLVVNDQGNGVGIITRSDTNETTFRYLTNIPDLKQKAYDNLLANESK